MNFLLSWLPDAKQERELHSNFSKVYNIMCILRVLLELLKGVGAGGCRKGMYLLKMTNEGKSIKNQHS